VEEVCSYLDALAYSRAQLADPKGLPLSMRLLSETHHRLMRGVRGAEKLPGEVRRSQNWIGGSRPGNAAYVPPPPHALGEVLGAFETYLHGADSLPPLVRAGLLHVQFETIHPYLDGNGRIRRLLVTLLLEHWKLLTKPFLYLSLFFKRHRDDYYRRLNAVRVDGDWEGWLDFFLDGVATIADEAVASARELFALVAADRARVLAHEGMSVVALRLFELLPRHPVVAVSSVRKLVETTKPTAGRAIELLVAAGVLVETTGKKRDRSFVYRGYLDRLRVGTELDGAPSFRRPSAVPQGNVR
jgi:Fic family protein